MSGTEIKDQPSLLIEPDRSWLYKHPTPFKWAQTKKEAVGKMSMLRAGYAKARFLHPKQQLKMWVSCLYSKDLFRVKACCHRSGRCAGMRRERRLYREAGFTNSFRFWITFRLAGRQSLMSGWFSSLNIWAATPLWAAIMLMMMYNTITIPTKHPTTDRFAGFFQQNCNTQAGFRAVTLKQTPKILQYMC